MRVLELGVSGRNEQVRLLGIGEIVNFNGHFLANALVLFGLVHFITLAVNVLRVLGQNLVPCASQTLEKQSCLHGRHDIILLS